MRILKSEVGKCSETGFLRAVETKGPSFLDTTFVYYLWNGLSFCLVDFYNYTTVTKQKSSTRESNYLLQFLRNGFMKNKIL